MGVVITRPPEWMARARCAETDPELFYPAKGEASTAARQICAKCEVVAQCLAYALDGDEDHGVWGGTSPAERHAMRRAGVAA